MDTVLTIVFVAMMAYVAWWLVCAIRARVAFEVEMGLGVGSLWAAGFTPLFFKGWPALTPSWPGFSLIGYVLLATSIGLFIVAVRSLRQGGQAGSNWEDTTALTKEGLHSLVRHPMQLSGLVGACAMFLVNPLLPTLVLSLLSAACFALAVLAEDRFNLSKFGEAYRAYMNQVPALNLPAGVWLRAQQGR
jgi:protein-S-isoprenylcysteine O-methyltransferase Ste14